MSVYQIYIRKQEHNKIETEIFIPNQIRLVISDLDKLFSRSNILLEIYSWPLARNFIMVLTHGSILETSPNKSWHQRHGIIF